MRRSRCQRIFWRNLWADWRAILLRCQQALFREQRRQRNAAETHPRVPQKAPAIQQPATSLGKGGMVIHDLMLRSCFPRISEAHIRPVVNWSRTAKKFTVNVPSGIKEAAQ